MNDLFGFERRDISLRDYQQQAVAALDDSLRTHNAPLLVLPTGCHAKGTLILMADGSRRAVECIRMGDQVMGPDSGPRTVTAMHAGIDDMYRIAPIKGESFIVNGGHVLSLRVNDGSGNPHIENISVCDYLGRSKYFKHIAKLYRVGVDFAKHQKRLPIAPYLLGVMIGDGALGRGSICVHNPDKEIRHAVNALANEHGVMVRDRAVGDRCPAYALVTAAGQPNPLLEKLRQLGLNHGSKQKHIPGEYLTASRADRLELLAGLIDTDGSLGHMYDYISASWALAEDVTFLARSLGLAAYVRACEKSWQDGIGTYWRVSISGDLSVVPCRVERKKAPPRQQKKDVLVTGFAVEPIGVGAYYGFECDGDHLYLLGDFTVTHNSGKTRIACALMQRETERGGRSLFLAPRRELIYQTSRSLRDLGIMHGVVMAQAEHLEAPHMPVQVGSIDTLVSRALRKGRTLDLPDFSLVIVDECHLAVTERRQELLDLWPSAVRLGLTATPVRKDGRALGMLFDDLVQPVTVAELTKQGYLVPARYFSLSEPDLRRVRITAGDYNAKDLEEAVNTQELVGDVVGHWLQHAATRRTVVFCCSIAHSIAVTEAFVRNGVAAEHVDANTPNDEREAIFARFSKGETQVLTNCFLASYGFDLPELSCVVMARPTKSLMLYLQMLGRGLRIAEGKQDCLVLDHAGTVHMHGFATDVRDWSLDGVRKFATRDDYESTTKDAKPIDCPECHAVFEKTPVCPECGYRIRKAGKDVEASDGELVEIGAGKGERLGDPAFYAELRGFARERGYKSGWAAHKYREKFDVFPPFAWNGDPMREPSLETRRWIKSRQIAWAKSKQRAIA